MSITLPKCELTPVIVSWDSSPESGGRGRASLVAIFNGLHGLRSVPVFPNPSVPRILGSLYSGDKKYELRADPRAVDCIAAVKKDPRLLGLFRAVETEPKLRRIMFAHKRQLQLLENIEVPLLYGDSPYDSPVDKLRLESSKAAARSESNMLIALDRFWPNLEQYLRGVIERINDELSDRKDSAGEISDSEGAQIGISMAAQMLFPPGISGDPLDGWIRKASKLGGDLIPPLADAILSMPKAGAVEIGRNGRASLTEALALTPEEYQEALERLHLDLQTLSPLIAIVWCTACRENPYSTWMVGLRRVPPVRCPTCARDLASGVFFYFDPVVARLMRQDDGLLAYATFWVAESSGIQWCPRAHVVGSEKFEHDMVFLRRNSEECGLVEVKVLALDTSNAARRSNINDGFSQLAEHLEELRDLGIPVSDLILVTNYNFGPQTEQIVKTVRSWDQFKRYKGRIELFGIEDFPQLRKYLSA